MKYHKTVCVCVCLYALLHAILALLILICSSPETRVKRTRHVEQPVKLFFTGVSSGGGGFALHQSRSGMFSVTTNQKNCKHYQQFTECDGFDTFSFFSHLGCSIFCIYIFICNFFLHKIESGKAVRGCVV